MKQLTCEVCGGNDLLKQDGVFVCQSCGCKYSADEVKKLMISINEPVKVEGINTIEEEIKNVYALIEIKNISSAEDVLKELEQKAPRNSKIWLAYAVLAYNKSVVLNTSPQSELMKCTECKKQLDYYYKIAINYAENKEEIDLEFNKLYQNLTDISISADNKLRTKLSNIKLHEYGCYRWNIYEDRHDMVFAFILHNNCLYYHSASSPIKCYKKHKGPHGYSCDSNSFCSFFHKIDSVDSNGNIKYSNEKFAITKDRGLNYRITSNECCKTFTSNPYNMVITYSGYEDFVKQHMKTEPIKLNLDNKNQLFAVDSFGNEYQLNLQNKCNDSWSYRALEGKIYDMSTSTGCYIATCVYGSYDCPEVWTLRRYRDDTLAKTWYGRVFIKTYYAISPTLVKQFGHTSLFKWFWKNKLDKMVSNLKIKGYEDKPYNDRKW